MQTGKKKSKSVEQKDTDTKYICDTCSDRHECEYAYDDYNRIDVNWRKAKCLVDELIKVSYGKW